MPGKSTTHDLQRDSLRRLQSSKGASALAKQLAALRVAYSEDHKLLTGYVNKLVHVNRIFPRHLEGAQASGRWSTIDPPRTNWPRACIEPTCQERLRSTVYQGDSLMQLGYIEHSWTDQCWSLRDICKADPGYVTVKWDHDNIEGRIHDLIVDDQLALQAHRDGLDLHTITCCQIFGYSLPANLRNPHSAPECEAWRSRYGWQGKDTKQRVLSKNFNHGSKYSESWKFVYRIHGVERYGVSYGDLGKLARVYIEAKGQAWQRKLDIMQQIRKDRQARSLYGFRRLFYDSSANTGREGFSHMISATVTDYNNYTLHLLEQQYGAANVVLSHNAHDGDEVFIRQECNVTVAELQPIIERSIEYQDRSLVMTAGIKVTS